MITFDRKDAVPGCLLHKTRTPGSRSFSDIVMTCDEKCEGCGWTEEEMFKRKYDIRAGKMQTNPKGLRTLYVIGNKHQHV